MLSPDLQLEADRIARHVEHFINRRHAQLKRGWLVARDTGQGPYRLFNSIPLMLAARLRERDSPREARADCNGPNAGATGNPAGGAAKPGGRRA